MGPWTEAILGAMGRSRSFVRLWVAIICIAVLAVPVNAHLHLCFDGAEAPSSLHLADDGIHHADDAAGPVHHDVDISLDDNVLAKKLDGPAKLPMVAAFAWVLTLVPPRVAGTVPYERVSRVIPDPDYRSLPPLRGPPV